MADVELYMYASCSSCTNAAVLLDELGAQVAKRDIFKQRMTVAEISELFDRLGLAASDVISKRSRPYVALDLSERELSDDQILDLMSQYPALIRRPIVVRGKKGVIGFNRSAIANLVNSDEGGEGSA